MANVPKKGPADDPRLALQVMREENNLKAAGRGTAFSLRLAFNRLMDRASRSKPSSGESAGERPSPTHPWHKRALLGLFSVGTLWMTLSPRAHVYLSMLTRVAFHLCKVAIGH